MQESFGAEFKKFCDWVAEQRLKMTFFHRRCAVATDAGGVQEKVQRIFTSKPMTITEAVSLSTRRDDQNGDIRTFY
ncbi:hypothetical protein VNO77_03145 [Canavalia gladiata]|uniref:Uncharacterized protein n=1 Tax=Canavalia gladiata TaxID=3824 RepID=A0AAN9MUC0_CANGL